MLGGGRRTLTNSLAVGGGREESIHSEERGLGLESVLICGCAHVWLFLRLFCFVGIDLSPLMERGESVDEMMRPYDTMR